MSDPSSPLAAFMAELKRRRVFRVAIVYAGVAFIIFQIVDATFEPLRLPDWAGTLVVVLLALGFPVAVALAWAFDITEKGVVKTPPKEEAAKASGAPRITIGNKTLAVVAALAIAVAIWSWWGRSRDPLAAFEHTVAVMPFDNLTGDESFDIWEKGMAMLLITDLSTSEELYVLDSQTLFEVINAIESAQKAQVIPTLAREVAVRARVKNVILGDILKAGDQLRLQARLLEVKTGEVTFSHFVNGKGEDDFFAMAQELSDRVKDYLEIKALAQELPYVLRDLVTHSAEAYRHYIQGAGAFEVSDYPSAIQSLNRAVQLDTNFAMGYLSLALAHGNMGQAGEARRWLGEAYRRKDRVPFKNQYMLEWLRAELGKDPREAVKWIKRILEIDPQAGTWWSDLGWDHYILGQYAKAVKLYEKGIEFKFKMGSFLKFVDPYVELGESYHVLGNHKRELKVYKKGLSVLPDHPSITRRLAICYLSQGDTTRATPYLNQYRRKGEDEGWSEARILNGLGSIHRDAGLLDRAQFYYRQAIEIDPQYHWPYGNLGGLLLENDLDIEQGLALVDKAQELDPENNYHLESKGWGLYKQGQYEEALTLLERAWELRTYYWHETHTRLEAARKAVAGQRR